MTVQQAVELWQRTDREGWDCADCPHVHRWSEHHDGVERRFRRCQVPEVWRCPTVAARFDVGGAS